MSTVTKAKIAQVIHQEVGVSKREAKELVEIFFEEIAAALERSENVKLLRFGSFLQRKKPARPGRNPRTGVTVEISARRVVTFRASPNLLLKVAHSHA